MAVTVRHVGQIEKGSPSKGYRWHDAYAVYVNGRELQPWLLKSDADRLAKQLREIPSGELKEALSLPKRKRVSEAQAKPHDEWKDTWDWVDQIWDAPKNDYSLNQFFREIASKRAEAEGWEELGSSDVWHATYDAVKRIKAEGKVETREELKQAVRDWTGIDERY